MKRPFRGFEVVGLAAVLAGGAACAPSNAVKSGAPVLIEVSIVEGGGATITSIPAGATACAAGTAPGGTCSTSADKTCFLAQNWCRCGAAPGAPMQMPTPTCTDGGLAGMSGAAGGAAGGAGGAAGSAGAAGGAAGTDAGAPADAAPAPDGLWNCDPFSPTAQTLFTFDRLIDTRPFDADAGASVAATVTAGAPAALVLSTTDYTPNGSPHELLFPAYGDFRSDGPSLLVMPAPALPASSTATVKLLPTAILAKDGKTPFTDNGNFAGGMLTFTTAPFSASVTPPAPPPLPADAGACATPNTDVALDAPATITFNSPVDPIALIGAVTVTVAGSSAPVPVTLTSMDGLNVTVAAMDKWPANADITITVAATAADLAGDLLGAPVTSDKFHTGAL
ncbi:MAG TPA: Ig-like domain-containing protein [Polyangia bacterium]|nr:Ig-like domain-containing protein [Polyangia bacterium]